MNMFPADQISIHFTLAATNTPPMLQVALDSALRNDVKFMKVAGRALLPVPDRPFLIGEGADVGPFQRCASRPSCLSAP